MKINTALILCAGYGKRLNPITLKIPKPLIKINEITLLENSINFLEKLEIEKIKINTYFLHNQIQDFILNYKSNLKIEILNDGDEILDTGGGILNLINKSDENDFLILNPDTLWGDNYLKTTTKMMDFYFEKEIKNLLMIVNKEKSFDKRMKGDFSLNNEKINKNIIIAAHGNSVRALCKYLFNIDNKKISKLEIPTGNPLLIKFDNKKKIEESLYLDQKRAGDLITF